MKTIIKGLQRMWEALSPINFSPISNMNINDLEGIEPGLEEDIMIELHISSNHF